MQGKALKAEGSCEGMWIEGAGGEGQAWKQVGITRDEF